MKFTCTVDIDIPRNEVIKIFDNPENMKYWQDGFIGFERVSGAHGEIGSKSKITYNNKGREMILTETLNVYNLPDEMTGTYEHKMMDNEMQNLFTELSHSKTRWTANIHYTRMKGFMQIISWVMPKMFKNQVQQWMNQFKAFAEKQ